MLKILHSNCSKTKFYYWIMKQQQIKHKKTKNSIKKKKNK